MHKYTVWSLVGTLAALLLTPQWAAAQQQSAPVSDAPPKLEKLDEGAPPSLKLGKPEDNHKVTEKRENDQIKVQSGGSTYYIKQNDQVGSSLPGDAQSMSNHGVQWKVKEFDLGQKSPKKDAGDASSADGGTAGAPTQK